MKKHLRYLLATLLAFVGMCAWSQSLTDINGDAVVDGKAYLLKVGGKFVVDVDRRDAGAGYRSIGVSTAETASEVADAAVVANGGTACAPEPDVDSYVWYVETQENGEVLIKSGLDYYIVRLMNNQNAYGGGNVRANESNKANATPFIVAAMNGDNTYSLQFNHATHTSTGYLGVGSPYAGISSSPVACQFVPYAMDEPEPETPDGKTVKFDFDNDATALFGIEGRSSSNSTDGDINEPATATVDGVSVTVSPKASGSNANRLWGSSPVLRMYSGTLTISAPGNKITGIKVSQGKWSDKNTFDSGTYADNEWKADSDVETVVLTVAANTQLKAIEVELNGGAEEPEPEVTEVATLAELNALPKDELFRFTGEATIVLIQETHLYIKDNTASSLIYKKDGDWFQQLAVGRYLEANWEGKVANYNGLFEAIPSTELRMTDGEQNLPEYETVGADYFTIDHMNHVVTMKGVTYTAPEEGKKNFTIVVDGSEIAGYNQFGLEIAEPTEGKTYTMVGAISVYNTTVQFQPVTIMEEDAVEPVETQFDESKVYTLGTARGYLPAGEEMTNLWGANYVVATANADEAGKFQLLGEEGNITIFNTGLQKYLSADGTPQTPYVDEANGTFTIYPATEVGGNEGAWIIKSNANGKWMMFGGSKQYLNNDGWSQADDGDQWYINEVKAVPAAELTLSYMLNETKTLATVTVEDMVEAEGSMVAYFLNDNEYADGMLEYGNTFTVAPNNAPETIKVTVRQYDAEMENILAEGEIYVEFPAVGNEPLFTAVGNVGQYPIEMGKTSTFPEVENVTVDVYEDYVYIHAIGGVEGYDLKAEYAAVEGSDIVDITKLIPIIDGVEQEAITYSDDLYFGRDDVKSDMVTVFQYSTNSYKSHMLLNQENGYVDLQLYYKGGYYLSWSDNGNSDVEKPAITPAEGSTVDELETFTLSFGKPVTLAEDDWDNWIFAPTGYILDAEGNQTGVTLAPGENEGEIVVYAYDKVVRPGECKLVIEAGAVIFEDGSQNPEYTYFYNVTGNNYDPGTLEEGEIGMTIVPADGSELSKIQSIKVTLTGYINPSENWMYSPTFYDAEGNEVATGWWEQDYSVEEEGVAVFNLTLEEAITEEGTYKMTFGFDNVNEKWTCIGTHTYEVTYKVDGSEKPVLLGSYDAKTDTDAEWEKRFNTEENTEVAFKSTTGIKVDVYNTYILISNFTGVEGYNLRVVLDEEGQLRGVQAITPGFKSGVTTWMEAETGLAEGDVRLEGFFFTEFDEAGNDSYSLVTTEQGGRLTFKAFGYTADFERTATSYYSVVWGADPNAINSVSEEAVNNGIYNLNGQKMLRLQKGVNIVNGKKVVIK